MKIPAILSGKTRQAAWQKTMPQLPTPMPEPESGPERLLDGKLPKPVELPIGRNSSEVELQMAKK